MQGHATEAGLRIVGLLDRWIVDEAGTWLVIGLVFLWSTIPE
jgi:hypothetical protein